MAKDPGQRFQSEAVLQGAVDDDLRVAIYERASVKGGGKRKRDSNHLFGIVPLDAPCSFFEPTPFNSTSPTGFEHPRCSARGKFISPKARNPCYFGTMLANVFIHAHDTEHATSAESKGVTERRQTMTHRQNTHDSRIQQSLIRGFWLIMLVSHAPALAAAWRGLVNSGFQAGRVAGLVFLAAAMLFFFAKLLGVAFLKVHLDRRSIVALCVAVALVHGGCLDVELRPALLSDFVADLATASAIFALCLVVRKLRNQRLEDALTRRVLPAGGGSRGVVWLDDSRPRCWVLASHLLHLRAPPV